MPSDTITNLENKVNQLKSFEKPEEIKRTAVITEDSLYLYGTDFMSTGDIKDYMGIQFPDIYVTWINDSSCTIKFDSKEQAATAYMKFSVRPATIVNETPEAETTEEQSLDQRNFDPRIGWREALSYKHDKRGWQNLWIRFATDLDVKKEETKGENSRFYK